eukprot:scaffold7694_cov63-Phaeocystis_antarctica.AAC.3
MSPELGRSPTRRGGRGSRPGPRACKESLLRGLEPVQIAEWGVCNLNPPPLPPPAPHESFSLGSFLLLGRLRGLQLRLLREEGGAAAVGAPVDHEGLADEDEHHADLHDREEAPDRGLLHQIGRDRGGHHRTRQQQEAALDQHAPLLPHGQKGREHHERVDLRGGHEVARVGHRHAPRQVILAVEGAQLLAAEPLGGPARVGAGGEADVHRVGYHHGLRRPSEVRDHEAAEEPEPRDEREAQHHLVLLEIALGARERGVDDVAEVRLHADVQEAEHREHLVDGAVAQLVAQVVGDHKVLEALQQLHGEEEEDAARELDVLSARIDPHRDEQPEEREAERALLVEAHRGSSANSSASFVEFSFCERLFMFSGTGSDIWL